MYHKRDNRSFSNYPLCILLDTVILSNHVIWVLFRTVLSKLVIVFVSPCKLVSILLACSNVDSGVDSVYI